MTHPPPITLTRATPESGVDLPALPAWGPREDLREGLQPAVLFAELLPPGHELLVKWNTTIRLLREFAGDESATDAELERAARLARRISAEMVQAGRTVTT